MKLLTVRSTAALTSTTSSQTLAVPVGSSSLVVYNGGANPVYLAYAASVAVPGSTLVDGVFCMQPGTTQSFCKPPDATTLAYIAATAGGVLVVSVGEGA